MRTSVRRFGQWTLAPVVAVALAAGSLAAAGSPAAGTAAACSALPSPLPEAGALRPVSELPDPFTHYDGTRMTSPAEWDCRRAQLAELLQHYQYGHLPPAPAGVTGTRNGNTLTVTVQANGRTASFNATLGLPSGNGPFPALILLNPLAAGVTARGYAQISIDPNGIAADGSAKTGAFWELYGSNVDTGVLMAWAWGVHRTLDALRAVPQIDTGRVGVSGYSRYGKAALVAGAFDERIAATFPGSSGTAGMGNYRFFFAGGGNNETLDDIVNAFPYWFTPRFAPFRGQATRLPFDQHSLAALVAPRPLLATNGTEGSDIRTNPQGASLTYRAAKAVYEYLGAADRIGVAYRPGGHQIDMNDYNAIMDFSDKHLRGLPVTRTFDDNPYPPSPAAIPWTIPTGGPTTPPPTPPPGSPCRVTYTTNAWNTGLTASITITNTGRTTINGWRLSFALPGGQTITSGWNAAYPPADGTITAADLGHNAAIPPGGSTVIGFQATHDGNPAEPTTFTLNNTPCTTT
ncbi:glucuronyl esterase domain-containing protein [Thermomonospora cellulosilytica]|uniref:CBM2 domain-containing protein n=1 Tax=Thermomonospora cellulosilytica TaxID=1411118 RepID=A0A7W3MW40_9ACTN|nr:cellulose binding domain-containing protein [Thermomonospora cellulosilytica]MBA9002982.1 hypothetical protein [Thermomonospora cellulosilytica]